MQIKKVVKRLVALSAGATMLGATVMGAMAADLSSYPSSFQTDGVFNGYFVVGEAAQPIDNLAMTDIATAMWYTKPTDTTTTTIEGDAWKVGTAADYLEINESIGPSGSGAGNGIVDYISDSELTALADGSLSNSKGTFKYEQKLHFDREGPKAYLMENEDDIVDLFWKVTDGDQIAKYELDFTTDAESDIDASDSFALKDFEDKNIIIMGTEWTFTNAKYTDNSGGTVALTLMGGAVKGTMLEGETQTYAVGGTDYEVTVTFVDSDEAAFTVNGEGTNKLEDGETTSLGDGTTFGVSNILYQDYAGGVHQASFFLGANKLYMTDNISDTTYSSSELKVNEETIDGAAVLIKGTLVTEPTTTVDGELKLDYFHINMTAQDDIYMAAGEKLSGDAELVEPELLFTQNWDFEYHGMDSAIDTNEVRLAKSGDDKYEIIFTANDGNVVTLPLLYAVSDNVLRTGKKTGDYLAMDPEVNITDDDYFVLGTKDTATAGNSDAVVTVLQYQSSKNSGDDTQTIKFKNLNTGEVVERTFDDDCVFDISLNGRTHTFGNASSHPCTSDNWPIRLTSTDYVYDQSENVSTISLRDASGTLIELYNTEQGDVKYIYDMSQTIATNSIGFNLRVKYDDTDRLDDYTAAAETVLLYNLTETDTAEVTASALTNPAWSVSDPDDTDVTWGYSATGIKVKKTAPSSTPVELTLTTPSKSAELLAYVTSGAATISETTGGELALVQVVDATKLDTEIADTSAQNLIVVGGPCVNSIAAELLGNPAVCTEGFSPGKARVKMFANGDNLAMLVAGYSGEDTRLAGKVVAHRYAELSGEEVEIAGTTYSDATIGAPTVVEEVAEVAEETEEAAEAAEETTE